MKKVILALVLMGLVFTPLCYASPSEDIFTEAMEESTEIIKQAQVLIQDLGEIGQTDLTDFDLSVWNLLINELMGNVHMATALGTLLGVEYGHYSLAQESDISYQIIVQYTDFAKGQLKEATKIIDDVLSKAPAKDSLVTKSNDIKNLFQRFEALLTKVNREFSE